MSLNAGRYLLVAAIKLKEENEVACHDTVWGYCCYIQPGQRS